MSAPADTVAPIGRLVVTRQVGESVWIGGDIEVRLEAIEHKRVRLVVLAPREVKVRRNRDEGQTTP